MGKLLYIESSPRKKRSASIEVSKVFIDEYKKAHPTNDVAILDLWAIKMPEFDGDVIDSKYAILNRQTFTQEQKEAWKPVEDLISEFKSADQYLFSIPMWNFSIPYKLKQYIDILLQPGYTFSYSEKGFQGLITGKKVILICARAGSYGGPLQELDLQVKYMKTVLEFIGFKEIQFILIDHTSDPTQRGDSIKKAKEEAIRLAINL